MTTDMCVKGLCEHPKHIQGTGFVQPPSKPIPPVLMNVQPKKSATNLITGDEALRIKAENDKTNYLVSQLMPEDAVIKRATRR